MSARKARTGKAQASNRTAAQAAAYSPSNDALKIIRDTRKAKPLMTKKIMYDLNNAINHDTFRPTRALALAVLTESGASLIKKVEDDRAFAVSCADLCTDIHFYNERLVELSGWLNNAKLRITAALALRPDAESVWAEGQRGKGESHERP